MMTEGTRVVHLHTGSSGYVDTVRADGALLVVWDDDEYPTMEDPDAVTWDAFNESSESDR